MITYRYDKQPTGRYDKKWHHCISKYRDDIFCWSWCMDTEKQAKQFAADCDGKDIPYPGAKK